MEFNDGSQYRVVSDPARHMREREMFEFRVASARNGRLYVDTAFRYHREALRGMSALLLYQFAYGQWSAEQQADFFCDTVGRLRPNEMVMLDIEQSSGISNPADFTRRWLARAEGWLGGLAWVYVPQELAAQVTRDVTGPRIVKAPRYSGGAGRGPAPWWPHDVHQYSDEGYFPGCSSSTGGDVNWTAWTVDQMLARCKPADFIEEDPVQNYPIHGVGRMVLVCPVGDASADRRQAWLSASVLDGTGSIRVFAQGDEHGVHDWLWSEEDLTPTEDHLVRRPWMELRNGVTKLVISWDLSQAPGGGVLCLETKPRA